MPDRKRDAAYVAGGTAASTAAMPARGPSNAKKNPYKKLPDGIHNVPMKDVHAVSRKTGARFQNRRYTAAMANHIKDKPGKPAVVGVYSDGSSTQVDGAHRIWARTMNGEKSQPVEIRHIKGNRPTKPGAQVAYGDVASRLHRKRLARDSALPQKKLNKLEGKLSPWAKKQNMKFSEQGSVIASRGKAKLAKPSSAFVGPSPRKLRSKQAAFLAGGAAAGGAAAKAHEKIKKSHVSAFGVDHAG